MTFRTAMAGIALAAFSLSGVAPASRRTALEKAKAVTEEDGKWFDADGTPTFNIQLTAPSTGTLSAAIAAITPIATSATGLTASVRPTRRHSPRFAEDHGLRHVPVDRRGRPQECRRRQGKRHAGLRRQQERLLLHGRPLRLSARPRRRRCAARSAAEESRQAAGVAEERRSPAWAAKTDEVARLFSVLRWRSAALARGCDRLAFAQGAGLGAAGELVDPDVLRVCADPNPTCRSPTKAARVSRTSWPSWWPQRPAQVGFLHLVSDGHGLRAQHAARQPLRRHHGLRAGRRAGAEHQRLLPLDLCGDVQEGRPARRGVDHRGSEAEGQAHRRRHDARRRPPTWRAPA